MHEGRVVGSPVSLWIPGALPVSQSPNTLGSVTNSVARKQSYRSRPVGQFHGSVGANSFIYQSVFFFFLCI